MCLGSPIDLVAIGERQETLEYCILPGLMSSSTNLTLPVQCLTGMDVVNGLEG